MISLERVVVSVVTAALIFGSLPAAVWAGPGPGREHRDPDERHDHRGYHRPPYGHRVPRLSGRVYQLGLGGGVFFYSDGIYYRRTGMEYVVVDAPLGAVVRAIPHYHQIVRINGVSYYVVDGTYYIYTPVGYQVVSAPFIVHPARTQIISSPVVENRTKVAEGITLGTILGAVTGGVIGYQRKGNDAARGALIGGVLGATAGGVIGAQVPNQTGMSSVELASSSQQVFPSEPQGEAYTVNIPGSDGTGYVPVLIRKSGPGFLGPQGEYYSEFPRIAQLQLMYGR